MPDSTALRWFSDNNQRNVHFYKHVVRITDWRGGTTVDIFRYTIAHTNWKKGRPQGNPMWKYNENSTISTSFNERPNEKPTDTKMTEKNETKTIFEEVGRNSETEPPQSRTGFVGKVASYNGVTLNVTELFSLAHSYCECLSMEIAWLCAWFYTPVSNGCGWNSRIHSWPRTGCGSFSWEGVFTYFLPCRIFWMLPSCLYLFVVRMLRSRRD